MSGAVENRLQKAFKKAMGRFGVIDDGDHILVGLSGGKDSLLLLELLAKRSRIIKPRFTVDAIHVRMTNVKYESSTDYLERFCSSLGVKLHVVTTSFDETIPTHKPKCFLCSWHRRKQMFNLAQQLGCNKIALGHHNDDIIHTALMNTIFQGHFSTMPVVLHMRKMPITIIRPLCYCEEKDIREYAIQAGYQKQVKLCPYETDSHRTSIRNLYAQIEQMAPEARYSIWNALEAEGKLVENTCETLKKNMIKNLIFDFGKVLVDYDFFSFFRKYVPDHERCKALTPVIYNEELQHLLDREEQPFDVIMEEWIRNNSEFEKEIRLFIKHYPELVTKEIDGMSDLLCRLKAEGFKLYGLTNWCSKVHTTISQFEIFKLLDGYVISSEEKVIKPEAEIYHRLFDRYGLNPSECIFTDDREENILGGRKVGMEGIVFVDAKQYESELRNRFL